ncbi:MAG: hypothetical protein WBE38_11560 [Terracidiphilus sp.]|jgi:hypothetical protein
MKRSALLFATGCMAASLLTAQDTPRGPDGRTTSHVSGVEVLAIPGKPFSATSTTRWTRTLEDGTTITLRLQARVARDGQGRIYRERHNFVPENATGPAPLYEIHLYDPVTGTQLLCNGRTYRCDLYDYRPQTSFQATPEGTYDNGNRTLTREYLGSDVIEGISVLGTRETMTISAGVAGNERPIVSTREFWYSDELETNLAVTRIDPVDGKQVIRLSDISRAEPDAHLWEVPVGFTVRDERASAGRKY